jgi:hypothetical protein
VETLKETGHKKDLSRNGTIILEWILGKWAWRLWTGFIWFRKETGGGLL